MAAPKFIPHRSRAQVAVPQAPTQPESEPHESKATGTDKENLARALRSISFLLDWGSEDGNKDLERNAALGFSYLLDHAAAEVEQLFTRDELVRAGGDDSKALQIRRGAAA
jgi:hypothetical protein